MDRFRGDPSVRSEMSRQSKAPIDFLDHTLLTLDWMTTRHSHHLSIIFKRSMPKDLPTSSSPSAHRPPISCSGIAHAFFPIDTYAVYRVEARRVQYDKLTENDTVAAVAHDFPPPSELSCKCCPTQK